MLQTQTLDTDLSRLAGRTGCMSWWSLNFECLNLWWCAIWPLDLVPVTELPYHPAVEAPGAPRRLPVDEISDVTSADLLPLLQLFRPGQSTETAVLRVLSDPSSKLSTVVSRPPWSFWSCHRPSARSTSLSSCSGCRRNTTSAISLTAITNMVSVVPVWSQPSRTIPIRCAAYGRDPC